MCGRFNLTAPGEMIAEEFGLDEAPLLAPRYNIAPSQPVATIGILPGAARRSLAQRIWGMALAARPAPEAKPAPRQGLLPGFPELRDAHQAGERGPINARSETAARSPAFRDAFARRRCLIPATGFYEWRKSPGSRPQPWLFQMELGGVFAFAGLWEPAHGSGAVARCLILTTEPNDLARMVHDRMPAILAPDDYASWLDPSTTSATQLQSLLRPFPAQSMRAFPVSPSVNNPTVDDRSCIEPVPDDGR